MYIPVPIVAFFFWLPASMLRGQNPQQLEVAYHSLFCPGGVERTTINFSVFCFGWNENVLLRVREAPVDLFK